MQPIDALLQVLHLHRFSLGNFTLLVWKHIGPVIYHHNKGGDHDRNIWQPRYHNISFASAPTELLLIESSTALVLLIDLIHWLSFDPWAFYCTWASKCGLLFGNFPRLASLDCFCAGFPNGYCFIRDPSLLLGGVVDFPRRPYVAVLGFARYSRFWRFRLGLHYTQSRVLKEHPNTFFHIGYMTSKRVLLWPYRRLLEGGSHDNLTHVSITISLCLRSWIKPLSLLGHCRGSTFSCMRSHSLGHL